ncbi:unnamed protein product [Paramecium sonneborni]|uniref:Uncharacterized protein n=1 Tax=Paramecium sonneborni TaxID=65129 RepID=A0A8S1LFF9_9CILI|nr:unnamed protein product [Paramecium sonneborni]
MIRIYLKNAFQLLLSNQSLSFFQLNVLMDIIRNYKFMMILNQLKVKEVIKSQDFQINQPLSYDLLVYQKYLNGIDIAEISKDSINVTSYKEQIINLRFILLSLLIQIYQIQQLLNTNIHLPFLLLRYCLSHFLLYKLIIEIRTEPAIN